MSSLFDIGVLRDTLIPNLRFHTALAVPTYLVARGANYGEAKDILWPTGQLANVWWTAVVSRMYFQGISFETALRTISRPGQLILAGVTLWGARLSYRVVSRALRRGHDDPRYDALKDKSTGSSAWTRAFFTSYLPEAIVQALITLPFTAPFRRIPVLTLSSDVKPIFEAAAIALFSAGFALETLADWQLARHQAKEEGGIMRDGVWSIVRHPNYLGDALIHFSFPLLLLSADLFNPIALLGPLTNWFFLRHVGGDKENEAAQEERYEAEDPDKLVEWRLFKREKNAFWPGLAELANGWTWAVVGLGAAGVVLEKVVRRSL